MKKIFKKILYPLSVLILLCFWGYFFITYWIPLHLPELPYSTVILDTNGREIWEIIYENTIRHRSLRYEDIPEFYIRSLVALEDRSFWSNNGVSLTWLIRSTWNNILAGKVVEGGSTLSSGLVRNVLWLNEKRSLSKKFLEFIYAIRLNHLYTKEEIITAYTNRVYFWYLNYGLASASRYYFAKDPKNLTKAEQITLLILPKDPKKYNPYKEIKAFRARFSVIIDTLQKNNLLSPEEAKNILTEELNLNYDHTNKLPYVTDFIERGLEKWWPFHKQNCWNLEKSGVWGCGTIWAEMKSENWWEEASKGEFSTPSIPASASLQHSYGTQEDYETPIRRFSSPWVNLVALDTFGDESTRSPKEDPGSSPGWQSKIITTIDADLTQKTETLARNTILDLSWKDVSDYGIIILDRDTNELRTMIGWVNYHANEWQVNSTLALRQPGSTIKPFTYLLAFQSLGLKPSDMILDLPTAYKTSEGYEYDPKNYSLDYKGQISIAEALSQSINIPAVKMADKVGVENLLRFLHTAGFTSLTKDTDYYGLGLTLGNGEVSLYELTRAYSIFANEGRLCDIKVLTTNKKIMSSWWKPGSSDKNLDEDSGSSPEWQSSWDCARIASAPAISDINLILTNRYFKLWGFPVHSSLDFSDRNVFVKTGTSRNFRDNWAVGYTDNYIIGVWTGNKSGAFMKWVSGATGAGEIFSRIVYLLEPQTQEQSPIALEKKATPFLEITSPLSGSVFAIDKSKPLDNQKIKLLFKTNIQYDAFSWLLDGEKMETDFILPKAGSHTLTCSLFRDGQVVLTTINHLDILDHQE